MTAFNAVRFRVKPGQDQAFLDARQAVGDWSGLRHANIIWTGEHSYCIIAECADAEVLARARQEMIQTT